jgi:hypothetical protein
MKMCEVNALKIEMFYFLARTFIWKSFLHKSR